MNQETSAQEPDSQDFQFAYQSNRQNNRFSRDDLECDETEKSGSFDVTVALRSSSGSCVSTSKWCRDSQSSQKRRKLDNTLRVENKIVPKSCSSANFSTLANFLDEEQRRSGLPSAVCGLIETLRKSEKYNVRLPTNPFDAKVAVGRVVYANRDNLTQRVDWQKVLSVLQRKFEPQSPSNRQLPTNKSAVKRRSGICEKSCEDHDFETALTHNKIANQIRSVYGTEQQEETTSRFSRNDVADDAL